VVAFEWQEPVDGGSAITAYTVSVKFDYEEEYAEVVSDYYAMSLMITQDVVEGAVYDIVVRAENRWGKAAL